MKSLLNKKILIIGYFGYRTNQIDGQTIKTRNIYSLLEEDYKVSYFDTEMLKYNKLYIFSLLYNVIINKNIYYLPGQNNLKLFGPIIFSLGLILRKKINYIVIGGWLYDFLNRENKIYTFFLKRINAILVETLFLKENLIKIGIKNVDLIPNFRNIDNSFIEVYENNSDTINIVFMARIMKEKGIYTLIEFIKKYNDNRNQFNKKINLDFYGPIYKKDEESFLEEISLLENVNYKGILNPIDIYKTLNKYDCLVLPTFYSGEGFPGTIVDAYLSGIPVIATNWKQIPEFIDNGCTGYIINNNIDELFSVIRQICNDDKLLQKLKEGALLKSKQFSKEKTKLILKKID